jgi:hypothetical protein
MYIRRSVVLVKTPITGIQLVGISVDGTATKPVALLHRLEMTARRILEPSPVLI